MNSIPPGLRLLSQPHSSHRASLSFGWYQTVGLYCSVTGTYTDKAGCGVSVACRFMYFPVRSAGRGRIDRCNMDGTNCVTLISVNTSWPSGLTIDLDGKLHSF